MRSIGIGVAGVALAGCEPVERAIKKIRETVEVKPTATNTPKATKVVEKIATNTPFPTEAPTKTPTQEMTPTPDSEATRQAQTELWEKELSF